MLIMVWIILAIVVLGVIALVTIGNKQKELPGSLPSGADVSKIAPADIPLKEIKDLKQGPPQVTIYGYSSATKPRLCAFCDGENDAEAARCCICGQQLN